MAKVTVSKKSRHMNRPRPPIECAGCGHSVLARRCTCIAEWSLHRQSMPLVRQLLESGSDLVKRRQARAGLQQLVVQDEQRIREEANYHAFIWSLLDDTSRKLSAHRDREILDHILGIFTQGRASSLAEIAECWHRSTDYVKDLRDRALAAMAAPRVQAARGIGSSRRRAA